MIQVEMAGATRHCHVCRGLILLRQLCVTARTGTGRWSTVGNICIKCLKKFIIEIEVENLVNKEV